MFSLGPSWTKLKAGFIFEELGSQLLKRKIRSPSIFVGECPANRVKTCRPNSTSVGQSRSRLLIRRRKGGRNPHLASTSRTGPTCLKFDGISVGVWRVARGCLEGIWRLSWGCLEVVSRMSGGCLQSVWRVSKWCLNDVLRVSRWCLEGKSSLEWSSQERSRGISFSKLFWIYWWLLKNYIILFLTLKTSTLPPIMHCNLLMTSPLSLRKIR